jgi:hypothetical protein
MILITKTIVVEVFMYQTNLSEATIAEIIGW